MANRRSRYPIIALLALLLCGCIANQPQPKTFKVGILQLVDALADVEDGFKAGMAELGYTAHRNVTYVERNAKGNMDVLERFAHELVDEDVDLIVSITTPASVMAMNVGAEKQIPVVFVMVSDPIGAGLAASMAQPGGRATGIMDGDIQTVGKRLEILQEIAPDIHKVLSVYTYEEALLPGEENLRQAAKTLGLGLVERQVHTTDEARAAFRSLQPGEADAVFVPSDGLIVDAQDAITELSVRDGLPQVGPGGVSNFVLASYGANFYQAGAQGASLADKVLKGTDPASLPVEVARDFDLILNLKVAGQIGITVPDEILYLADSISE